MEIVQPIRDPKKVIAIKKMLRGQDNPRDYLLFVLGINTALRISDLLKLNVGDVLDNQGEITDTLYVRVQKTKKAMEVDLPPSAVEAIKHYFDVVRPTDHTAPLFISDRTKERMNRTQTWRLINRWCRDVGLTKSRYGNHTLRKSWGYMARKYNNVDISVIRERLGHQSTTVTERYIGVTADEVKKAVHLVNL